MTDKERRAYETYLANRGSVECAIITAKADGEMIGLEKGIAQGIAQIVLNMHKKGYSIADIADATELSENDVKDILKNNRVT